MTLTRAKLSLLPLLAAVCLAGTGCGSVSKLIGGKKRSSTSQQAAASHTELLTSFTVTANPSTGELKFQPVAPAAAASTGGVHQQATSYTRAHDLEFEGRASYNNTTKVLAGDVTLLSGSATTFQNVKVIVTNISSTEVTVKNNTGVTDLSGANKPYWSFGNLPASGEATRNWQFNVPSGVSFTFTLGLYADVWSTPPNDAGTINGIAFLGTGASKGWAVGQGGKILYTANGGTSWSAQTSNVATDLKDVCFINSETGWAVGNFGTIIATTNGGKTWRPQNSGVSNSALNGVAFVNASVGYVVGANGLILRTGDGGNNWQMLPPGDVDFNDVDAVGNKVWVVGNGPFVLVSDNYGDSFSELGLPPPSATDPPLYYVTSIEFVDGNTGWVGGTGGMMYKTWNGGQNWQREMLDASNVSYRPTVTGLKFVGSSNGWAVANSPGQGAAFHTTNGGDTWNRVTLPDNISTLQCVSATSAQQVWVAGDGGVVFLSTNGGFSNGGTWSFATGGTKFDLKKAMFPTRNVGYVVGSSGTVLKTTNGGQSWGSLDIPDFFEVNGLYFVSATTGWVVGSGGRCFKTTDGGQNWTGQDTGASGYQTLNAIYMIDQNNGWAVGQAGTILVTHSGGNSWDWVEPFQGPMGSNDNLNDIRFLPGGQVGYIVGSGGRLLFTQDGGNWEYGYANTNKDLFGIATAGGKVWLVGKEGTIRKLADDGSWMGQDPGIGIAGVTITLRGVEFLDANRGFIVGGGGTLLQTNDGGNNWARIPSATTRDLYSVEFYDEDMGLLVGRSGTIKTFR